MYPRIRNRASGCASHVKHASLVSSIGCTGGRSAITHGVLRRGMRRGHSSSDSQLWSQLTRTPAGQERQRGETAGADRRTDRQTDDRFRQTDRQTSGRYRQGEDQPDTTAEGLSSVEVCTAAIFHSLAAPQPWLHSHGRPQP